MQSAIDMFAERLRYNQVKGYLGKLRREEGMIGDGIGVREYDFMFEESNECRFAD